jgi:enoyl-CoA hydratase/carnithine racemase
METGRSRLVDYRTRDGVARITLNNPPLNCFTFELMHELDGAILQARFDDGVHALVLCGEGERAFSAGDDVRMLQAAAPGFRDAFFLHASETLDRLERTPKLVVAALNGHAIGSGLELALAADLRVARRGAGQVGLPELRLGLIPGLGGVRRLAALVGSGRAAAMMLGGALTTFEEARGLGLVNEVWEAASAGEFVERALAYARGFGPPQRSPAAVAAIKRSLAAGREASPEAARALEQSLQQALLRGADAAEGLRAFLEKREPGFGGS